MTRPLMFLILGVAGLSAVAHAATPALQPFEARYEVWLNGKHQGESTIRLERLGDGHWRHRVAAAGTAGLARLAGVEAEQDSEFRLVAERPRMDAARVRSEAALRRREIRTAFDWQAGTAHWEGDVKPDRRGPLPLEPGATNGPLLNLLLALDVAAAPTGSRLRYPLFERGRIDRQEYRVGALEAVTTPAGRFDAVPVVHERSRRDRVTTLWFAPGLPPTPVRMLQTEGGKPKYELRLRGITGG
jgi:hypothetical protein